MFHFNLNLHLITINIENNNNNNTMVTYNEQKSNYYSEQDGVLIKIMSWNLKGYKEEIDGYTINKFTEEKVTQHLIEHDIIFVQETHLDEDSKKDIYLSGFLKNCHFIRRKRNNAVSASGGISVFIKDYIKHKIKILPRSDSNIIWLHVKNEFMGQDVFIGCIYIPPEHSSFGKDFTNDIWHQLESDIEELSTKGSIILCGDMNSRTGEICDFIQCDSDNNRYPLPDNYCFDNFRNRQSYDKVILKQGRRLVNACINNNLYILNGRTLGDVHGNYTCFTYNGCSTVDYIICSKVLFKHVIYMKVNKLTVYSDHCSIEMKISLPIKLNENKDTEQIRQRYNKYSTKTKLIEQIHKWDQNSHEKLQLVLNTQNIKALLLEIGDDIEKTNQVIEISNKSKCINNITNKLSLTLTTAAKQALGTKTKTNRIRKKKKLKKWFDNDCFSLRKEMKSLLNSLNRHPYNKNICQKYYATRKKYKSTLKKKKRLYRNQLVSKLNEDFDKDPNSVWKTLKELKTIGEVKANNVAKINPMKWINHLKNLIGTETKVAEVRRQEIISELNKIPEKHSIPTLDKDITEEEIRNACKSLKNKKSPGKDKIINELIKSSLNCTIQILVKIFNLIFSTGLYPEEWKNGISIPIHKKGDPFNPSNYRGITLTNNLGKLFCKIINSRISSFLEKNDILLREQAGFRKNYRTTDQIFILKNIVDDIIKTKNGRLYGCFVDFQKAFDNVWHDALLLKLYKNGIKGKCYQIIKNMYNNSKICTRIQGEYSKEIVIKKGVHQGNTLSPTLFNIFINDITNGLPDKDSPFIHENTSDRLSCLLYADDLVLLSKTKKGLQNKLDFLYNYCQQWGLIINTEKTKIIPFCRTETKISNTFKCGEDIIQVTDQYKYLGVIFHKNGNFDLTQDHLNKQGNKAAYYLRKAFINENVQTETILHLFDMLVHPILTYGAEVWFPYNFTNKKDISNLHSVFENCLSNKCPSESTHIKFCRFILGVHKKAMWLPVLGELGRFPLSIKMISQVIGFWGHILDSNQQSLLHHLYSLMISSSKTSPWLQFIKQLLSLVGFEHVWKNQFTFNANKLQFAIQQKIMNEYVLFWKNKKSEKCSRLEFYSLITERYTIQAYLIYISNINHRKALAKLRTSTHSLKIETGRHRGILRENRLCNTCKVIEDELHFLDNCKKFNNIRKKLVEEEVSNCDLRKPSDLLFKKDEKIQKLLGAFVFNCFNIE